MKLRTLIELASARTKLSHRELELEGRLRLLREAIENGRVEEAKSVQDTLKLNHELLSVRYELDELAKLANCILTGPEY